MTIRHEPSRISEIDLHAYADGLLELDADRLRRIEDRLAQSPEERSKVEAYRRQRNLIRHAFGNAVAAEIPPKLRTAFGSDGAHDRRPLASAIGFAIALLVGIPMAMTAGDFWNVNSWVGDDHVRPPATATGSVVSGEHDRASVNIPDFSSAGLNYIGRETLKIMAERTVWRVRYADTAGNEVELLVMPRPNESELVQAGEFERPTLTWTRGEYVYSLHSDLPPQSQQALARAVEASQIGTTVSQRPSIVSPSPDAALNAVRTEPQVSPGTANDPQPSQTPGIIPGAASGTAPISDSLIQDGPLL